jgi:gelsolin
MATGLIKAKEYDWKDSNLALFGSDTDKKVKKDSALTEPAWKGAGQKEGLKIWRIVNFKVTEWPQNQHGKFYNGDSYIILNTYKPDPKSNELAYDVHFWIGSQSSQDEYGTAAYKTVELDTFLDDKPVQHREVQGYESELFRNYFKQGLTILEGGAETGFHHVKPTEYKPRLLHFSGQKQQIYVHEVPLVKERLDHKDVFILDLGLTLYQWNGKESSKEERFKAMQYLGLIRSERPKAEAETLEDESTPESHKFYTSLTGIDEPNLVKPLVKEENQLLKVSDAGGHLKTTEVKRGAVNSKDFSSNDVFILDTGDQCFVWVGKGASQSEKQSGLGYAHAHLMKTSHPLAPIHVIKEGQVCKAFNVAIAA